MKRTSGKRNQKDWFAGGGFRESKKVEKEYENDGLFGL